MRLSCKTRRLAGLACILSFTPFLSGCGLVFGGTRQVIRATSSPDGASIASNPQTADYKTPASLSLERKNNYTLTFTAPGYSSQTLEIQKSIRGGIVVLDILFGLVPLIVDAATGSWNKLSPEVANVSLTKVAEGPGPDRIEVSVNLTRDQEKTSVTLDSSAPGVAVHIQPH